MAFTEEHGIKLYNSLTEMIQASFKKSPFKPLQCGACGKDKTDHEAQLIMGLVEGSGCVVHDAMYLIASMTEDVGP